MQLAMNSFQHVWYVDGKPISNVIIFDKTGALLVVERGWLSSVGGELGRYRHSREIAEIEEITRE